MLLKYVNNRQIKRELTVTDIAGYLPTLRMFKEEKNGASELFYVRDLRIIYLEIVVSSVENYGTYTIPIRDCAKLNILPVLHPMSDLTKVINHAGDAFIPMERIRKISRFFEYDHAGLLFMRKGCTQSEWLNVIDLLNKWKFDYRGLITEGLAIDVNRVKRNPYI